METKKSERADLEKGKWTSLLIGFTIALAVMFVALEWTQSQVEDNSELYTAVDVTLNEELVPITMPEKKTVPPPPAAVTKAEIIEIIDDDADIIEEFIVNRDGSIVEPEVVKSVNPMLDKEALRVISNMPKWKPGLQRGQPVRVKFTVPVNFRLN